MPKSSAQPISESDINVNQGEARLSSFGYVMPAPDSFDKQENSRVIDAFRGYAILIVIFAHATPYLPSLVWPMRRVLIMGTYGVQLFFIASALTLMMSWSRSQGTFIVKSKKFFIRRLFRIAPLYFLAIPFYWFAFGKPSSDFSGESLMATMGFYNAWSPYLIPTVPGWMPVPGGWSIGVEFNFYFLFPILAIIVLSVRRSLLFVVVGLLVMILARPFGESAYKEVGQEALSNFLYFWPPNQLVVFAFGFLLYHMIKATPTAPIGLRFSGVGNWFGTPLFILAFLGISFYGQHKIFDLGNAQVPTHFMLSIVFAAWAYGLLMRPNGIVVNRFICMLGKVSFSAYILHFAVLYALAPVMDNLWRFSKIGVSSIFYATIFITIGVTLTFFLSLMTYKWIEKPFIAIGKKISSAS